jgi:hypothetical protein
MAASTLPVTNFLPTYITKKQTNTMQQSLSSEANSSSVTKIPALFGNSRFITTFTTPFHPFLS